LCFVRARTVDVIEVLEVESNSGGKDSEGERGLQKVQSLQQRQASPWFDAFEKLLVASNVAGMVGKHGQALSFGGACGAMMSLTA
jgi:hypothetical protein